MEEHLEEGKKIEKNNKQKKEEKKSKNKKMNIFSRNKSLNGEQWTIYIDFIDPWV